MNIIIFGTGSTAEKALKEIDQSTNTIIAVSDNNEKMWDTVWCGFQVINPAKIPEYDFDYVFVCSMYINQITDSLIQKGVPREKIISYYKKNLDKEKQRFITENQIRKQIIRKVRNNKIALLTRRNSGCNCIALYKNIPKEISERFSVSLLNLEEFRRTYNNYEVSFTTIFEGKNYKTNLNLEIWHGFPIKSLGYMEKNLTDNISNVNNGIDYCFSYSSLYNYLLSACYNIDIDKFIITGMPRNDLLINPDAKKRLNKIANKDLSEYKILFYMPTFRKRIGKPNRDGMKILEEKKDFDVLNNFLKTNNYFLFVKKHPVEEDTLELSNYSNICYLDDNHLFNLNIDVYEILGGSDLLITDYSSVYFDYLLLEKPVIFWQKDKNEYNLQRGFLFDNIQVMMPGPILTDVEEVIEAVEHFFKDPDWYSKERLFVKNLVHKFCDFNSSQRVWTKFLEIYDNQLY